MTKVENVFVDVIVDIPSCYTLRELRIMHDRYREILYTIWTHLLFRIFLAINLMKSDESKMRFFEISTLQTIFGAAANERRKWRRRSQTLATV